MCCPAATSQLLKKVSIVEKPGRNFAFSILIFLQSFKMCFIQISISGKIIFFSEGLFIHSQYGSITISKDHINKVKFYNPVCIKLLVLSYESYIFSSHMIVHLYTPIFICATSVKILGFSTFHVKL